MISIGGDHEEKPVVFVDRDGTIIDDVDYLSRLQDIRPIPGAAESLERLRAAGFAVVLVTNQSGVARGYFSEDFVRESHKVLEQMLNFRFDGIYYCPHGPDDACRCRKPGTGMLDDAVRELGLTTEGGYVVGDKPADMDLARNGGLCGVLVRTGYGTQHEGKTGASFVAADIAEACDWILSRNAAET